MTNAGAVGPLDVLYVDDDADIRTIVTLALGLDPGIGVHVAASGDEALAMVVRGLQPDALLLDVMMPGMDGPTLLARLRQSPALAAVPVIFMTAKGRQADIEHYLALGAVGVILKPFDPVELSRELRALLR